MPLVISELKKKRYMLYTLLLWVQLVFGMGMTLWRHGLVLFSDWEVYPPYVEPQFDEFIALAKQTCASTSVIIYVSPGSSEHTARFARLHYFLYPFSVVWWSPSPVLTPLDRWQQMDLTKIEEQKIQAMGSACFLVDDLTTPVLNQSGIQFDLTRRLFVIEP